MSAPAKKGDRIRLDHMADDPDPIPVGTTGTIEDVVPFGSGTFQLWVKWDVPRSLALVVPPDRFTIIE
jgi:hypothetical protein